MNERDRELALQVDLMRYPSDGINIRIERFAELVRADERETIAKREWVGLTDYEAREFYEKYTNREELIYAIDKFLEEKNNG